jgi:hypothetical protein
MKKSKLSHLKSEKLEELIDCYYNSDFTVKELIELFDLKDIKPTELYKHFPPVISDELKCRFCGVFLVQDRQSKSAYSWRRNDFYCPECGHIESKHCSCENCIDEAKNAEKAEIERKRQFLLKHINQDDNGPVDIDELSFTQKVYLGAMLRAGVKQDFELIEPINTFRQNLAPSHEYEEAIFDELYFNQIITIHPSASLNEFTTDYNKDTFTFKWRNIPLNINIQSDSGKDTIINELLNPPHYREAFSEESLEVWKQIIYWECIDLFRYRMEAYGFEYKIGKDTKGFFESTLEQLPISQIYSIIWNGAKNSAAYYQEGKVPKQQAANSTLSRMRNSLDKILSGQWNQYDYSRPKEVPQSVISEYYFNSITKICDQGWFQTPALMDFDSDVPHPE